MEDRELLREIQKKLDDLETSLVRLVDQLEADDKYRDRLEKFAEKERDERHEQLEEALEDLRQRVESNGAAFRDLPDRLLQHVKKTIYELRTAEWQALQAGATTVPLPARDPTPQPTQLTPYREPTGKIAVAAPDPDDVTLTPAQQRGIARVATQAWRWGRWAILPALGGLAKWFHELITAARNIGH